MDYCIHEKILRLLQEEAMSRFPFFPEAFGRLKPVPGRSMTHPLGTDGIHLFYEPSMLRDRFLRSSGDLRRMYLHLHLHCLCLHVIRQPGVKEKIWDMACDLWAARLCAFLVKEPDDTEFLKTLEDLTRESPAMQHTASSPKPVLTLRDLAILTENSPALQHLASDCVLDTHQFWSAPPFSPSPAALSAAVPASSDAMDKLNALLENWGDRKQLLEKTGSLGSKGSGGGSAQEEAVLKRKDSVDYHQFLQRFAVHREEAILDADSFDYIPYYYGLSHYGNLPLLEPLEYQEVNRLDEFAIAIDTSGSCSGRIVRRFLEETWNILRQKENFFSRIRLHLFQCDSMIQDYRIFTSMEEWEDSLPDLKIQGHGNTDFRPVFECLHRQIAKGEIKNLRGLLYFTDGDGIFPEKPPDYDTAFVFLNDSTEKHRIPPWAIRLNLQLPEDF